MPNIGMRFYYTGPSETTAPTELVGAGRCGHRPLRYRKKHSVRMRRGTQAPPKRKNHAPKISYISVTAAFFAYFLPPEARASRFCLPLPPTGSSPHAPPCIQIQQRLCLVIVRHKNYLFPVIALYKAPSRNDIPQIVRIYKRLI